MINPFERKIVRTLLPLLSRYTKNHNKDQAIRDMDTYATSILNNPISRQKVSQPLILLLTELQEKTSAHIYDGEVAPALAHFYHQFERFKNQR